MVEPPLKNVQQHTQQYGYMICIYTHMILDLGFRLFNKFTTCAPQRPSTQRVQVPNASVLGFWVIGIIIQVLGEYMITGYYDP